MEGVISTPTLRHTNLDRPPPQPLWETPLSNADKEPLTVCYQAAALVRLKTFPRISDHVSLHLHLPVCRTNQLPRTRVRQLGVPWLYPRSIRELLSGTESWTRGYSVCQAAFCPARGAAFTLSSYPQTPAITLIRPQRCITYRATLPKVVLLSAWRAVIYEKTVIDRQPGCPLPATTSVLGRQYFAQRAPPKSRTCRKFTPSLSGSQATTNALTGICLDE
jgi:hypothetical protein